MRKTKKIIAILMTLILFVCMIQGAFVMTDAASYQNGYTGAMAGDGKIYTQGIDVSKWNSSVDFASVKNAGYTYVIIKAGSTVAKDPQFETYYTQAKAAGLNVGIYYYSYATTVADAIAEADECLSWISGKTFEYPIYFDYEDESQANLGGTLSAQICYAFLDKIKAAGYLPGLYSMASWLEQSWVTTSGLRNDYEGWVARYMNSGDHETMDPTYSTRYGMYQYNAGKYINGKGPFDVNVCYKDYPTIVKTYGFNGYSAENKHPLESNPTHVKLKDVVFDAEFYYNKYEDARKAFGLDEEKLYDHFLEHGLKEGRCASPYFDVKYYMTQNDSGLLAYCNGDYMVAYEHFLEYVENPAEMTGTPKKFSKILDINYYKNAHLDLRDIGWTTEYDYLMHFVNNGVYEWRQGSAEFDPVSYAYNNPDLFNAYGTDNVQKYYAHYLSYGIDENDNPDRAKITEYADLGDSFYATISEATTGKVLEYTLRDDKAVTLNAQNDDDSQIWYFEKQTDGSYKIENVKYNKFIDVRGDYLSVEDKIVDKNECMQNWKLLKRDGSFIVKNVSSQVLITVSADSTVNKSAYSGSAEQKFVINKVSPKTGKLGDTNGDGVVSVMDATKIQFAVAQLSALSSDEIFRADVDADNALSVFDATYIQQYIAQIDTPFDIGETVEFF